MITINTISPTRFSFNGVIYHKNFMPFVTGNKIAIINVYDGCITLTDAPTIFSDYTVNGVTYSSVNDLQSVLLDVIYTRNSLTNAAITLTTTGNSGAATLTGITLNIPNYTLAGLGGVGGTGTTNFLPKFTGGHTLGNSALQEVNGNLGLGVTPSAWSGSYKTIQNFAAGISSQAGSEAYYTANAFFDAGWKYIYSNFASRYEQVNSVHAWYTAPSGTAGNAISFTQAMTLGANGNLLLGTTSDNGARLQVQGSGTFSGSLTVGGGVGNKIELKDGAAWPIIRRNTSTGGIIFDTEGASIAGSIFSVKTLNGSDFLTITSSGAVGIGTTSPTTGRVVIAQTGGTQLHLISGEAYGSADVVLRLTSDNDYRGRGLWMDNSATAGVWYAGVPYTGGSYSVGYHATQPEYLANSKFFIDTTGKVGIGTTSPAERLDVNGLINSTNGISVGGEGVSRFWTGTQAQYDAITTKVSTTVYLIT